jgi:hypothetical protein
MERPPAEALLRGFSTPVSGSHTAKTDQRLDVQLVDMCLQKRHSKSFKSPFTQGFSPSRFLHNGRDFSRSETHAGLASRVQSVKLRTAVLEGQLIGNCRKTST